MNSNHRPKARGFTIVEVMIVLAVTSVMFLSVALVISGKQASAEFQSSIHDVQAQIQQIITETASGTFPDTNNFSCTGSLTGSGNVNITTGTSTQGTNVGCVFLGKVVHFSSGSSTFSVFPLAGLQGATGTLDSAGPTLVTPAKTLNNLQYGLTAVKMYANGNTSQNIGSLAFTQSLGTGVSVTAGNSVSGVQTMNLVVPTANGSSLGNNDSNEVAPLQNALQHAGRYADSSQTPTTSAEICFASGGTNQSGLITVGASSNGPSVTLKIYENKLCQ